MPSPADQLTSPAPGAAALDEPKVTFGSSGSIMRVKPTGRVEAPSRRPSWVKLTTPERTWPGVMPPGVTTSVEGTMCISEYQMLGVALFRNETIMVRAPPLESARGTWISKSGFTPVRGSLAYIDMLLVEAL